MSSHKNNNSTSKGQDCHPDEMLCQMKEWVHSLTLQQLLDAMVFPMSTSSNEYDLLIEMVSNQSPPPTPIHPRAVGFKNHATNCPLTDGRFDEEERVLRNRFERPRLFQFIERCYSPTNDGDIYNDDLNNINIAGLGLPPEIAAMIKEESKHITNSKNKKGGTGSKKRCQIYDVLAKKFIAQWGDVYSIGSTYNQRQADMEILVGTHIQNGITFLQSNNGKSKRNQICDCYCKFDTNIHLVAGKTRIKKKKMDKTQVLQMLHVVSRGRFLSMSPKDQIGTYWSPWLNPTKEWFSLSLYLASRFESALWSSFQLSISKLNNNKNGLPQTFIESSCKSILDNQICQYLTTAISRALRYLFSEISVLPDNKIADLDLHRLILNCTTIATSINKNEMASLDINKLISIQLINLNGSRDNFRKHVVQSFEDILREEAEKSLVDSCPNIGSIAVSKSKLGKISNRKKKKNRRRQPRPAQKHLLNSIDEKSDSDASDETDVNHSLPLFRNDSRKSDTSKIFNKDTMFILQIIECIYTKTFNMLGFVSDDEFETTEGNLLTKVSHNECKGNNYNISQDNNTLSIQENSEKIEVVDANLSTNKNPIDNEMTMKKSNLSSYWSNPMKQIHQLGFHDEKYNPDGFYTKYSSEKYILKDLFNKHPSDIVKPTTMDLFSEQSHNEFHDTEADHYSHEQQKYCSIDNNSTNHTINNFCLDSAFDRIEKSLINDLLDTELKGQDHFASSTAASIASSMVDFDNDQDFAFNHSNHSMFDSELPNDSTSSQDINVAEFDETQSQNTVVDLKNNDDSSSFNIDIKPLPAMLQQDESDSSNVSNSAAGETDECSSNKDIQDKLHSSNSPKQRSTATLAQSSPILVSLAEFGEFRKLQEYRNSEAEGESTPPFPSSLPSSPKIPTRSWSREDLRIPLKQNDSHAFRSMKSMESYRNVAKIRLRKTPSLSSHEIDRTTVHRRQVDSSKFARSVSSFRSAGNEVIIDGSLQFNVCAQSETALDAEDSSHWNVIPKIGIDDDGATTISSIPSAPLATEEVTFLREERDAYRDMCLTLGSEIAKLKNVLALENLSSTFNVIPPRTSSFEYINTPQCIGSDHTSYQSYNRSLDSRFVAKSDAGMVNDTQMSEDGTDAFHGSVAATDISAKHCTVNSIGNMRLPSINGGRAGSDVDSYDHDTGFSVFNPPTSTFILRHETLGPAHLHGLQSRLSRDMDSFLSSIKVQLEKDSNRRELARKRLTSLVTTLWPRAQVKVYGSHVTGLCLPSSDLDFVICLPAVHKNIPADTPGALEGRNAVNESNQKLLARKLKSESWIEPSTIKIIERTAVPVIKVSTKDIKSKSLQLDISFDAPEHHGLDAIELVTDTMSHYPMVRPLVLILKQFLLEKGLLTAYTGGLSSYCLFLMVTKYLQSSYHGWADIGCYLMGFLDFYGNHFDPRSTGISVKNNRYLSRRQSFSVQNTAAGTSSNHPSQHQPGLLFFNHRRATYTFDPLYVEDPISRSNNVGRNSFRINQVQRAFSDVHRALVASLEWDMNSAVDCDERCPLLKCLIQRDLASN